MFIFYADKIYFNNDLHTLYVSLDDENDKQNTKKKYKVGKMTIIFKQSYACIVTCQLNPMTYTVTALR